MNQVNALRAPNPCRVRPPHTASRLVPENTSPCMCVTFKQHYVDRLHQHLFWPRRLP
jgi:hypothetical protein